MSNVTSTAQRWTMAAPLNRRPSSSLRSVLAPGAQNLSAHPARDGVARALREGWLLIGANVEQPGVQVDPGQHVVERRWCVGPLVEVAHGGVVLDTEPPGERAVGLEGR
jgi:hypothetical protein